MALRANLYIFSFRSKYHTERVLCYIEVRVSTFDRYGGLFTKGIQFYKSLYRYYVEASRGSGCVPVKKLFFLFMPFLCKLDAQAALKSHRMRDRE